MLVCAALGVILARNPVHCALLLVLCFFNSAVIWLMLDAEFLGIVLVLVYVGAVMVLFLFVVMMLDIDTEQFRKELAGYWPLAVAVAGFVVFAIINVIVVKNLGGADLKPAAGAAAALFQHPGPGQALFTRYAYPAQIAAVILLVASVAAIILTLRRRTGDKPQDIAHRWRCARRIASASSKWPPRKVHDHAHPVLALSGILFAIAVAGVFLNRKNVIVLLMCIELMLLAVNFNFVAFSRFNGDIGGQIFVFFILTVAAAEAAIGLAILVVLFRERRSIDVEDLDTLQG